MKISTLFICLILIVAKLNAQWAGPGAGGTSGDIYRTGNVAIGTTTVAAPLTVYQSTASGTAVNNNSIIRQIGGLTGATGGNKFFNSVWLRKITANDNSWYGTVLHDGITIDGTYNTPGTNTKTWWERNPSTATQSWGDLTNTYMTLKSPGSLTVGSPATGNTSISLSISAQSNGYGTIQCVSAQGSTYGNIVLNPTAGNVLVGKTSQANTSYLLDVDGDARVNKLVVNTTGADFVFQQGYKLLSLNAVSDYINRYKHLPGIESAKQMQSNGEDVGDLNTKLPQKVEELTLYVIQLKKQNDELNKRINKINKIKN